jgi:hypothetical protein
MASLTKGNRGKWAEEWLIDMAHLTDLNFPKIFQGIPKSRISPIET